MRVRRCDFCNEMFNAQLTGLMSKFCRPCSMDCDSSYMKVYKYLRDEQAAGRELNITDIEAIAEGSKISPIFVKALYEDGRFHKRPTMVQDQSKCRQCGKQLKATERELCINCGDNLGRAIVKTKVITEQPPEPALPEVQPSRVPAKRDNKENKYGLGR